MYACNLLRSINIDHKIDGLQRVVKNEWRTAVKSDHWFFFYSQIKSCREYFHRFRINICTDIVSKRVSHNTLIKQNKNCIGKQEKQRNSNEKLLSGMLSRVKLQLCVYLYMNYSSICIYTLSYSIHDWYDI